MTVERSQLFDRVGFNVNAPQFGFPVGWNAGDPDPQFVVVFWSAPRIFLRPMKPLPKVPQALHVIPAGESGHRFVFVANLRTPCPKVQLVFHRLQVQPGKGDVMQMRPENLGFVHLRSYPSRMVGVLPGFQVRNVIVQRLMKSARNLTSGSQLPGFLQSFRLHLLPAALHILQYVGFGLPSLGIFRKNLDQVLKLAVQPVNPVGISHRVGSALIRRSKEDGVLPFGNRLCDGQREFVSMIAFLADTLPNGFQLRLCEYCSLLIIAEAELELFAVVVPQIPDETPLVSGHRVLRVHHGASSRHSKQTRHSNPSTGQKQTRIHPKNRPNGMGWSVFRF
jgi:hypothetical protein